jgi:hypothetical protein
MTYMEKDVPRGGRSYWWGLVLGFVLFPAPAYALIITMSFESVAGSVTLLGAGTPNATLNFGNVSAFEPLNPGVTRTVGASSYTISTNIGVRVTRIVSLSPDYTLQARLQSAHPLTWRLDGMTLSTAPTTISTSQQFGSVVSHTLAFVVPYNHAAGAVTTVLEVTAIGN